MWSEDFRKCDVAQQPLLGACVCAVFDAGHLAVLLVGLVQTLVTVDVDQAQLLRRARERVCVRRAKIMLLI